MVHNKNKHAGIILPQERKDIRIMVGVWIASGNLVQVLILISRSSHVPYVPWGRLGFGKLFGGHFHRQIFFDFKVKLFEIITL